MTGSRSTTGSSRDPTARPTSRFVSTTCEAASMPRRVSCTSTAAGSSPATSTPRTSVRPLGQGRGLRRRVGRLPPRACAPVPRRGRRLLRGAVWTASMVEHLGIDDAHRGRRTERRRRSRPRSRSWPVTGWGPARVPAARVPGLDDRGRRPCRCNSSGRRSSTATPARGLWDFYLGEARSNVSPYAAPARGQLIGLPPRT